MICEHGMDPIGCHDCKVAAGKAQPETGARTGRSMTRRDGDHVVVIMERGERRPHMLHEQACREVDTKAHVEVGHEPMQRRFMIRAQADALFPGLIRCKICGPSR